MEIIKCTDGTYGLKLKKLGRVKRIFADKQGRLYYNRGSMTTYLSTIERLPKPYVYEKEGKKRYITGYEYIGSFSWVYVEVLEDNESVQLWTEI